MGDSVKVVLRDALRMVGIVPDSAARGGEASDEPQASWDLYEMIQAFMQVDRSCY